MYKPKLILLLLFLITLVACGPNDDENIPVYQEAIYIMDSDGENKTKVIDVDECDNVQFIPNSNKLLYLADNSLYTVNLDGSENLKISGNVIVNESMKITFDEERIIAYFVGKKNSNDTNSIFSVNLNNYEIVEIIKSDESVRYYSLFVDENILCYVDNTENPKIVELDLQTSIQETLYSTENMLAGLIHQKNSRNFFFLEKIGRYKSYLKFYDYETKEIELITDDASTYLSHEMVISKEIIVFRNHNQDELCVFNMVENEFNLIGKSYRPQIYNDYNIIASSTQFTDGFIFNHHLESSNVSILAETSAKPFVSIELDKIVFITKYRMDSKNILVNQI